MIERLNEERERCLLVLKHNETVVGDLELSRKLRNDLCFAGAAVYFKNEENIHKAYRALKSYV